MREVQRATAGASTSTAAAGRRGGVLFVHRFSATLNAHVHLHLCMLDRVVAQGRQGLTFRRVLVTVQAGRKLGAGRKPPRPKVADSDSGAPRSGYPARYLWAQLLARIYGVFALKCSGCGCNFLAAGQGACERRIKAEGFPEAQANPAQEQQQNAALGGLRRNQHWQWHRQLGRYCGVDCQCVGKYGQRAKYSGNGPKGGQPSVLHGASITWDRRLVKYRFGIAASQRAINLLGHRPGSK